MGRFIETVVHVCDYVQAKKRSSKVINLSFDEWNVWFPSNEKDKAETEWKVACMAQLVNVIAPIRTEDGGPSWVQTIYWSFYFASRYGRGKVLDIRLQVPAYQNPRYKEVPYADAVLVYHEDKQELALFMVNRSLEEDIQVDLSLSGLFRQSKLIEHIYLYHDDLKAINDKDHPETVKPMTNAETIAVRQSWNLFRFAVV
ncbi:MAG: hypothetical protein EOM15_00350 [Spirochaetia bacterium]|nr:hypothetical protein [Spirochaetia bacterium]